MTDEEKLAERRKRTGTMTEPHADPDFDPDTAPDLSRGEWPDKFDGAKVRRGRPLDPPPTSPAA